MLAGKTPLFPVTELKNAAAEFDCSHFDVKALEDELRSNIEGELRFDAGSKVMYAVDASN